MANCFGQTSLNNNWLIFNKDNSQLVSNNISEIYEDYDHGYWVSTVNDNLDGYLQIFENGNWITYDSTNSPLNSSIIINDITNTQDGKLLFATNNGLYVKSGGNWDSLNISNTPLIDNFIFKITVDKLNRYWLGIPNYGVAVYGNGNWAFYDYQNSFNGIEDLNFIEVDSLGYIWIGTDYYGLYYYDNTDWIKSISGQFSGGPTHSIVALSVDSGNVKWIAINQQGGGSKIAESLTDTSFVYYDSTDWGYQFSLFSYDGAVIDQNNIKYFGTTDGLIKYDGVNWQIFNISNSPIPANWFKQGILDFQNNIIYNLSSFYPPSQNYGLVFYNEDSVIVTSMENNPTLINNFYLFQNNPNPFNSLTRIKFSIPKSDKVQIKVYDILGNELQTLLNEYKHAGIYEVNFDANNLPSGVYFYRITTGAFTDTKKLVLLK
jgi:ligand-binding sensor domain-containing protein